MTKPPKLFSYVVDHDYGENPNPYNGFCTLVHCKFRGVDSKTGKLGKRKIVEMAEEGDWIVGTGGKSSESTGMNDCIIYIMQVTEKVTIKDYITDTRFTGRCDCYQQPGNEFALVSERYCYFGKNAFDIGKLPLYLQGICKSNPSFGYRSNFSEGFINDLIEFFEKQCNFTGQHGEPCCPTDSYRKQLKNITEEKEITRECKGGCK